MMPDASYVQSDFRGGEWSPHAQGLVTDPTYRTGMNKCRNSLPIEEGAATRRPGTKKIGPTRLGVAGVLREFHFSENAPYNMVFTPDHLEFVTQGGFVTLTNRSVTAVSGATPAAVTIGTADTWATGDRVVFTNTTPASGHIGEVAPLLGRFFLVTRVDSTHYTIADEVTGDPVDGSGISLTNNILTLAKVLDFTTSYSADELQAIHVVQSQTLALILHGSHPPQELTASGLTLALTAATFLDGPYLDPPTDGTTITPDAAGTTTIAIVASTPQFASTDVGRQIRLFSEPLDYAPATAYVTGNVVKFNGAYWRALAGSTGKQPDISLTEWAIDPSAAAWSWGTVTAVADSTHASVTLADADPNGVLAGGGLLYTNPIQTWRFGVYSDTTGYPKVGTYHKGRFWLSGQIGNRVDTSMSNQLLRFSPTLLDGTVADDCGISALLEATDVNTIFWMVSEHNGVILGTQAGEWLIQASSLNDPITPTSITADRVTKYGCANVEPRRTGLSTVLVQRYQKKVYEYISDVYSGKFSGTNISLKAKQIVAPGVVEIAYQQEITPVIWARLTDGTLAGCSYKRESPFGTQPASFAGWHLHALGGTRTVNSIQSGPSDDGAADTLSLVTKDVRTGVYYVEQLTKLFEEESPLTDAWFLDGAIAEPGADIVTVDDLTYVRFYGLWYQEGQTVSVFGAALDLGDYVVTNAQIDVPIDQAGFPLTTALIGELTGPFSFSTQISVPTSGSGYVMQAKENYDSALAGEADGAGFPTQVWANQYMSGLGFDPVRRELTWQATIENAASTNTSGHTLWDGATAIAPTVHVPSSAWNFYLVRKNIDTGTVTYYSGYDAAQLVPAGIGGGDGTWRRYVSDTNNIEMYPSVNDPRTGDVWVHTESCNLSVFRRADNYALAISPLRPSGDETNPVLPVGMNDDWTYATEVSITGAATANLYLIPRLTTAAETSADELLAYATYSLPTGWVDAGTASPLRFYRTAVDANGDLWFFACNRTGDAEFKLYKFTQPSTFSYPTPPSDGGFTDETPWTSSTGPNAPAVGATLADDRGPGRMAMFWSPDRRYLNLMSVVFAEDFASYDDQNTTITMTTYDTQTGTWSSSLVGRGKMTSAFVPTTVDGDTSIVLDGQVNITNQYLEYDSYYTGSDPATRWIFAAGYELTMGSPDYSDERFMLVQFTMPSSVAVPAIAQVVDEQGWDDTYSAYATAISHPRVVYNSIYAFPLGHDSLVDVGNDVGLYDPTQNAFWWGGMNTTGNIPGVGNMFQLDSAFTGRAANSAQPPVLKLSFNLSSALTLPVVLGDNYVSQCQILRAISPQEAGAANGPALGKTRRTHQAAFLFHNTQGVATGTVFTNLRPCLFEQANGAAIPDGEMFSGVFWNSLEDDYTFDSMICWETDRPFPTTVVAVEGFIHTQDR